MDKFFRNLPDFKGKRRLARLFFGQKLNQGAEEVLNGKFGCRYSIPNLKENIGFDIFVNGVYEEKTINYLGKILPKGGKYLDLGANIGAILIPLCKKRPDISAIAVEAAPWIFEYLEKNISLNELTNVVAVNNALFDKDDISMDFFSPRDKYGKGSLSPVFSQEAVKVISKRVDTIMREHNFTKVDVIKADVEGFEYYAFKGAEQLLQADSAPDIIFEFVDWAEQRAMDLVPGSAQRFLLEMGYQLYTLEKSSIVKLENVIESGAADLIASKNVKF